MGVFGDTHPWSNMIHIKERFPVSYAMLYTTNIILGIIWYLLVHVAYFYLPNFIATSFTIIIQKKHYVNKKKELKEGEVG